MDVNLMNEKDSGRQMDLEVGMSRIEKYVTVDDSFLPSNYGVAQFFYTFVPTGNCDSQPDVRSGNNN